MKTKKIRLSIPEVTEACQECGRPLDGAITALHTPWCTPNLIFGRGWLCGWCSDARRYSELAQLPETVRKSVTAWLAVPPVGGKKQ